MTACCNQFLVWHWEEHRIQKLPLALILLLGGSKSYQRHFSVPFYSFYYTFRIWSLCRTYFAVLSRMISIVQHFRAATCKLVWNHHYFCPFALFCEEVFSKWTRSLVCIYRAELLFLLFRKLPFFILSVIAFPPIKSCMEEELSPFRSEMMVDLQAKASFARLSVCLFFHRHLSHALVDRMHSTSELGHSQLVKLFCSLIVCFRARWKRWKPAFILVAVENVVFIKAPSCVSAECIWVVGCCLW